jgi:hypothetical protein
MICECGVHMHNKVHTVCTHIIMVRIVFEEHKGILLVCA